MSAFSHQEFSSDNNNNPSYFRVKEQLYSWFYEWKSEIKGEKIELDENEFFEKIRTTSIDQILNYIRKTIQIVFSNYSNSNWKQMRKTIHPNKTEISQYENMLRKLEEDNKKLIKYKLQTQLIQESWEDQIVEYISMQDEYEEMKEKFKYEEGKFLDNDRKDNEIVIIRAENTKLKEILKQYEVINSNGNNWNHFTNLITKSKLKTLSDIGKYNHKDSGVRNQDNFDKINDRNVTPWKEKDKLKEKDDWIKKWNEEIKDLNQKLSKTEKEWNLFNNINININNNEPNFNNTTTPSIKKASILNSNGKPRTKNNFSSNISEMSVIKCLSGKEMKSTKVKHKRNKSMNDIRDKTKSDFFVNFFQKKTNRKHHNYIKNSYLPWNHSLLQDTNSHLQMLNSSSIPVTNKNIAKMFWVNQGIKKETGKSSLTWYKLFKGK